MTKTSTMNTWRASRRTSQTMKVIGSPIRSRLDGGLGVSLAHSVQSRRSTTCDISQSAQ